MKSHLRCILLFVLLPLFPAHAQTTADTALLKEINGIRAIDNHAHVMSVAGENGGEDEEYDAIACDKLEFIAPPAS